MYKEREAEKNPKHISILERSDSVTTKHATSIIHECISEDG